MNRSFLLLLLIVIASCKTPQKSGVKPSPAELPLFTVNGKPTYPGEFIYAFEKSHQKEINEKDVQDYLELYINFKLKVQAARQNGLDTMPNYLQELETYLSDIKKPYLVSEKINESLLKETYDRLQKEINASHLLIRVDQDASAEDTLAAYNKIMEYRTEIINGASFQSMAKKYSEDPSAKVNGGELGWFTAFQMVYPFESAAYNTAKGEVSAIVRTQYGYHLVYVNDIRETLGRVRIAHIMKRFKPNGSKTDSLQKKKEIYDIHNQLIEGESWFALATKYSDDLNSKDNGGLLPWFTTGKLPPSLENAAFKLEQKGQISSPIKSPYGWHILKLEDKLGMGNFESMKASLEQRIKQDQRSELKTSEVINKLKIENNFKANQTAYDLLQEKGIDSVEGSTVLFTIAANPYYVKDFSSYYNSRLSLEKNIANYERAQMLAYEDEHLIDKYPEYRYLSNEYKEGLLLFEIMNQKVWNKVSQDSIGLKAYFENFKSNYRTDTLFNAVQVQFKGDIGSIKFNDSSFFANKVLIDSLDAYLKNAIDSTKHTNLRARLTIPVGTAEDSVSLISNALKEKFGKLVLFEPIYSKENKIYLQLISAANKNLIKLNEQIVYANHSYLTKNELPLIEGGIKLQKAYIFKEEGLNNYLYIRDMVLPSQRSFSEVKGQVLVDYQNYLEKQWLEQLKSENTVTINQKVLDKTKETLVK